jgi:hypothetical protein
MWVPSFGTQRQPKEAPKLASSSLHFPIMLPPFNSYYRPRVRQGYQGLFSQVRAPGLRQANTRDQVEPRRKGVMFRSHGPVRQPCRRNSIPSRANRSIYSDIRPVMVQLFLLSPSELFRPQEEICVTTIYRNSGLLINKNRESHNRCVQGHLERLREARLES